jgi:hypothetical protein
MIERLQVGTDEGGLAHLSISHPFSNGVGSEGWSAEGFSKV